MEDQPAPARPRRRAAGQNAVAEGASGSWRGGTADGPFFQPTVVTGVPTGSALWTEEIFAPIAPIVVVSGADEAIALANDTGYGLVNWVETARPDSEAGKWPGNSRAWCHVNDENEAAPHPVQPFGQSGLGAVSGGGGARP